MSIKKADILSRIDMENYYRQYISGKVVVGNNSWMNARCPFHDHKDKEASFGFNVSSGAFKCFGCDRHGNIFTFEQLINNRDYGQAVIALAKYCGVDAKKAYLESKVERYQEFLLGNKDNSLKALNRMGISRKVAEKLKLGYMPQYGRHEARLIFPIFDENGDIFTLKKYSRKVLSRKKSTFERGGKVSLYGIDEVKRDTEKTIVICAGEKDKAVAQSYLGDEYIFVTFTGGEGSFPREDLWDKTEDVLKGRNVVIAYDCDKAGQKGARKLAEKIRNIAKSVSCLQWSEKFQEEFPKGDITDFLRKWKSGTKELLRKYIEKSEVVEKEIKERSIKRKSGNIIEMDDRYEKESKSKGASISNFIIIPKERIWVDGKEAVRVILKSQRGEYDIVLEKEAWHSRSSFLKEIPSIDISYNGSDTDLQNIQSIVASYEGVARKNGTRLLGYNPKKDLFVLPEQVISKEENPDVFYVGEKGEHSLSSMLKPKMAKDNSFLEEIFTHIFELHEKEPLAIFLGWMFATPFKTKIMESTGHFPILNVYGTRGSGKSSLSILIWRLFGFSSGEIFSCTQSPFSWLKLLSSTNTYPLFFDEFKPWDMAQCHVQRIKRLLRRVYIGEIESRGKPDQTLNYYKLQAPVGVLGEVSFREPALLERILPVPLSFQKLDEKCRRAYKKLFSLQLEQFLPVYLKWCLNYVDIKEQWQESLRRVNAHAPHCSERMKDNIATALFGLRCIELFTKENKLPAFDLSEEKVIQLCINELAGDIQGSSLSIDTLLDKLSYMAESGILSSIHYKIDKGFLCLRLKDCLPIFREWSKRTANNDEILDWKAYKQMLKERKNDYVEEIDKRVWINGRTQRCVLINREKAKEFGLSIEGFFPAK